MASKLFFFNVALAFVAGSAAQIYTGPENAESPALEKPASAQIQFSTQTVYGFLDFTTTIGNTVMVFSPHSAPAEDDKGKENAITKVPPIETKPAEVQKKNPDIQPSKTHKSNSQPETNKKIVAKGTKIVVNSVMEPNAVIDPEEIVPKKSENVKTHVEVVTKSPVLSTVVKVRPKDDGDVPGVKNNLAEPEYDFLSTQPAEVVDETYKLINLRPSSKLHGKLRPSRRDKENPTGLVTKLGGTIVKDGLTTVHETSVIGTYINGKYAQVLQSSSRLLNDAEVSMPEGKIKPTNSQRILKTIGPHLGKGKVHLEATPTTQPEESAIPLEGLFNGQGSSGRPNRRQSSNHQSRPKFRNKITDEVDNNESVSQPRTIGKNRPSSVRPSYKNRPLTTTTEQPTTRRRSGFRPNGQPSTPAKFQNKITKSDQATLSSLPKLKLPRTQGRWSYKTTPKPRIVIRKQVEDDSKPLLTVPSAPSSSPALPEVTSVSHITTVSDEQNGPRVQEGVGYEDELDESESEDVSSISVQEAQATEQIIPVETLNVEISTHAEFNDIYFEIATIKSPYSFQVGNVRNTRFITVTSTLKKSFATADPVTSISPTEPLTENILANTGAAYETTLPLDSSVATLPAITLEAGQATPPLETITETFSTTQTLLKTHLLPIVANGNTSRLTLVQTYNIARVVTAIKTLPPMEIYQFIPSKTLNEFNSKLDEAGSELHLELDFGDDERDDDEVPKRVLAPSSDLDSDLDIFSSRAHSASKVKNNLAQSSAVQEPQLTPEQAQQLALFKYFGQAQPTIITTSRPVVTLETIYESHVIPVLNNGNTVLSTLSRPVGTVPKTSYEFGTSTISPLHSPLVPQLPQVPQVPQVPLFPQQQQFTVTTAPLVTQTLATISDSRVLKLTFGAKTAFTTLYSTKVVPTEITTYVTSTIALQPTVPAFPGYYPPPVGYPPYPFVG
ncbi:uncharacterized protein LOC117172559 isoform X2 [Belonocnema kinseyi]|uniref:uncharacterized protein LOC117172559 isoform X2 n=1 Tax=Belonocnema kinseyi TaxID=2817044 RepID=UPI00143DB33F|nr:uncharacterized protein LOC117172559 isoform X2 [Belonocnema kinseyi]